MNKAQNAIEKIHEFERFGSVLGLERMTELLRRLGDPQEALKVVHIAGTNGKGSVSRYIYSVLREAGYRTGLYTSPFLEKFNERIELDGNAISDGDLNLYTGRVLESAEAMVRDGFDSPTEFEVVTAIAFLYFKEKACDYVVLEVGLGGSGDSTNVCKAPLVAVITSISMDHMDRLGNTIEKIAAEKAGIIKEKRPVVTSASDPAALAVIKKTAEEKKSGIFFTGDMMVDIKEEDMSSSVFDVKVPGREFNDVRISMAGRHQIENAVAALAAVAVLEREEGIRIGERAVLSGMAEARQTGRFEVFRGSHITILDGAHNEGGAKALADTVTEMCPESRILMVAGLLADKDAAAILKNFMRITHDFIATEPENPRKLPADVLAEKIISMGGRCTSAAGIEEAFKTAEEAVKKGYDIVIYAGSLYMIGKVRTILNRGE